MLGKVDFYRYLVLEILCRVSSRIKYIFWEFGEKVILEIVMFFEIILVGKGEIFIRLNFFKKKKF